MLKLRTMELPDIVAHRGYAREYPENTRIAIEAALTAGVRYVETDVQLTRDRVPVLFHDRDLQRLCAWPHAIHNYDWATLQGARASEYGRFGYKFVNNPLMTLAQFVETLAPYPDVTAFVEVKRIAIEQFGIEVVLDTIAPILAPIAARCVLISFSLDTLAQARLRMRGAAPGVWSWSALGAVFDYWKERKHPLMTDIAPEYLFVDLDGLPRFGHLHDPASKLVIYEVADAATAIRLARRGVELVETFACAELRAGLDLAR